MELTIQELVPETNNDDLERLVPAFLTIWNDPSNLPFLSFTGRRFEEKQVRAWFSQHLRARVRYDAAISPNGHIVGVLLTHNEPIDGFQLMSIGILPEQKRKGVGRRLIERGVSLAMEMEYRTADAQVYATNTAMLRLLLDLGFVPVRMEHRRGPAGEDLVHLKLYFD
jgi:ribosomal protein S18 acetylase RimI-like enzyme